MGFSGITGASRLSPGTGIPVGSVGFGVSTAAAGAIEHRPLNAFGAALNLYGTKDDTTAMASLSAGLGTPQLKLGDGVLKTSPLFQGQWTLQPGPTPANGLLIDKDSTGVAIDAAGTAGLKGARLSVQGPVVNGINDPAHGDTIVDGSNGPNGTFFNMIDVRQTATWGHKTRGSLHQFQGSLELANPTGETNIYAEGFNCYMGIVNMRRGPLVGNWESDLTCTSGNQARAAGVRVVMRDENLYSTAYTSAIFGTAQSWHLTGMRGFEAVAQPSAQGGANQRIGTGLVIHGVSGWEWALQVLDTSANRVSGIDGNGGVFTRTKAGAPVDGDFRQPTSGLLALDTTNSKLYARFGTTWKSVTLS